jgi:hypothetical protein
MMQDDGARAVFHSLAQISVGDGMRVLFWTNRWINDRAVENIAPEMFALVPLAKKNRMLVADALWNNNWLADISGTLTVEGCVQCLRLWEDIDRVQRDETVPDAFSWTGAASGCYSPKDTYKMLCQGGTVFTMHAPLWKSYAPLKCKIFGWLALRYRLWTSNRRFRHGLAENTYACFFCDQEEDTVDHILVQCPYARQVWFGCLLAAGINVVEPRSDNTWESWWAAARGFISSRSRRGFDTLAILIVVGILYGYINNMA